MENPRTLGDYFAQGVGDNGGRRMRRLCGLLVDGRPLGEYAASAFRTSEERKQFEEMQWLGIALVGCDADLEIKHVRYVGNAPSLPDFEAATRDGRTVRIEVARIIYGDEMQQNGYFAMIAGLAEQILAKSQATANIGRFVYRVYDDTAEPISKVDAERCASELAEFIGSDDRLRPRSTTMYPADDLSRYPTMMRLGMYVCHDEPAGTPAHVVWDPMTEMSNPERAMERFDVLRSQKASRFAKYSGNGKYPVWLAFGGQSLRQRFIALTLVEHLAKCNDVDPAPFERILVGCYTAGVTFMRAGEPPRYTSLTTTG